MPNPTLAARTCRAVPALALALLQSALWTGSTSAQDFAGVYEASPARVTATVEKWGEDCGVRPKSYTLEEQPTVPIHAEGEQLRMQFPSGVLRTDRCWSQNPALRLTEQGHKRGAWRAKCVTPPGDPKSEVGVYEVVARDAHTLELTESSRYDWQLKDSHCVATVRIVRTLKREPEPGTQPEPLEQAAAASAEVEAAGPKCVPGTLAALSLVPAHARTEPGQRVCFTARARDAQGCRIARPEVHWSVRELSHGQGRMRGNCFVPADSAAEGEGTFRVRARQGSVHATAVVNVRTPDLSDITAHNVLAEARPLEADGFDTEAAKPPPVKTQVAARSVANDGSTLRWVAIAALAGLLALGATIWGLRQRANGPAAAATGPTDVGRVAHVPEPSWAAAESPASGTAATVPSERPQAAAPQHPATGGEAMICPTCRRGYPPGARRCETDDTPLVTYQAFSEQAHAGDDVTCAACGATFSSDTVFCGKCGARLRS